MKVLIWINRLMSEDIRGMVFKTVESIRSEYPYGAEIRILLDTYRSSDACDARNAFASVVEKEYIYTFNIKDIRGLGMKNELADYLISMLKPDVVVMEKELMGKHPLECAALPLSGGFSFVPENGYVPEPKNLKKLAVVTPLPPLPTGIADYIVELCAGLKKYYHIDFVTDQSEYILPEPVNQCSVKDICDFKKHYDEYDRVLYQMGNSEFHAHMIEMMLEYPGAVVLHDFFLGHLMAWAEYTGYISDIHTVAMYFSHGVPGLDTVKRKEREEYLWDYPANRMVFAESRGVFVHSFYAKKLAERFYGNEYENRIKIIPQVHDKPEKIDKQTARKRLGINQDDFVFCCFGHLGPTKLNRELVQAFKMLADEAGNEKPVLIFAGQNEPHGYGDEISEMIKGYNIKITGFIPAEDYGLYLQAADAAVQLRTKSRGETSRAMLDCMAYGLPLIVNANGSFPELAYGWAEIIDEKALPQDLKTAMKNMRENLDKVAFYSRKALEKINNHLPEKAAAAVYKGLEQFYSENRQTRLDTFLKKIEPKIKNAMNVSLARLAKHIDIIQSLEEKNRLYVDISALYYTDIKSGIQRTVRAILRALVVGGFAPYEIVPVHIVQAEGGWYYKDAEDYMEKILEDYEFKACSNPDEIFLHNEEKRDRRIIEPTQNDIFFGLDYEPFHVVSAAASGLFEMWRERGVTISFVIYDLLPLKYPQYFMPGFDKAHSSWLSAVASCADKLICISDSVADDTREWIKNNKPDSLAEVTYFHLGADIESSVSSNGLPDDAEDFLAYFRYNPTFIMVGTVEPRKGHYQTVKAFDMLLQSGEDVNLLIVGKKGWLVDHVEKAIVSSPFFGRKIFWFQGISDEYLSRIYQEAKCLIAPSEGEGFGLPLIEAAQKKIPIIARDLPVFKEVAGNHAHYFSGMEPESLADSVKEWLRLYKEDKHPKSDDMPWKTWAESCEQLKMRLFERGGQCLTKKI